MTKREPSQTAITLAAIPIALIAGFVTAQFVDGTAARIAMASGVGAAVGIAVHVFVKYWLLGD